MPGLTERQFLILDSEYVEFEFQPGDITVVQVLQCIECVTHYLPGVKRHAGPVLQVHIGDDPRRVRRPGQDFEGHRIGRQHHVAGAAHLLDAEAAVCLEQREYRRVGCVFAQVGEGIGHAVLQGQQEVVHA